MEERKFEDVVRSIEMSEKDVDRILKVARLSRIEKPRMSDSRVETICGTIIICMCILMFALVFIVS
jgi:t-SNARE complex subunit (syntaxin)